MMHADRGDGAGDTPGFPSPHLLFSEVPPTPPDFTNKSSVINSTITMAKRGLLKSFGCQACDSRKD